MLNRRYFAVLLGISIPVCLLGVPAGAQSPSAGEYSSIHEAVAQHPGVPIYVPAGDHVIDRAIDITTPGSGLFGPGVIIQSNPEAHVIRVANTSGIRITDVTLTRPEGARDTLQSGLDIEHSQDIEIRGVRVLENRSPRGCIVVDDCREVRINDCTIRNYKTETIDDRTANALYGAAFRSIDGTGIKCHRSQGLEITGNRVIEDRYLPTKELRDKYELGTFTILPDKPGELMTQEEFDTRYTSNWHQGAGLQVSSPEVSERIIIRGNYYENAAQGMDIHADHVIIADNMIYRAMIGMKAMHGAKNVLISGNHFSHCDLWGLLLMPGAISHGLQPEAEKEDSRGANVDGGTVVANNIFSDFGYGGQHWNWADRTPEYPERNVIAILFGQLKENPPLRTVLINGNVVYNTAAEGTIEDGKAVHPEPRYNYALYLEETRQPAPVNIKVVNNLLESGSKGDSNIHF